MGNKISLDDIQSRLGKQASAPSRFDGFDDDAPKRGASQFDQDEDDAGSTISAGFIATCVAAFVAVGGGTFFAMGGDFSLQALTSWKSNGVYADYVSPVDAKCGQGWGDSRENKDQLYCYMTTKVTRLCDPQEKGHFLNVVQRFQDSAMVAGVKMMGETMKMVGNQGKMMQFGMAGAVASQQGLSEEEQMKAMEKVAGLGEELMGGLDAVAAESRNVHGMDDLKAAMRKLAEKGHIKIEDFGWTSPDWVKDALNGVVAETPICAA